MSEVERILVLVCRGGGGCGEVWRRLFSEGVIDE